jgi:dTDP-4-dehydrorhamnose 3,5-epimerase
MPFTFTKTDLDGLLVVQPRAFPDDRGYFLESYKKSEFAAAGIPTSFVQDNQSFSSRGVLRGIHYQLPPHAQGKLVRVLEGVVWDVGVDLRRNSPSFGRWFGLELSGENHTMLYVPPGFGHGFLVLSPTAHFLYKCTAEYDKASEGGVRWDDPELSVEWPTADIAVSEKDRNLPYLGDAAVFDDLDHRSDQ